MQSPIYQDVINLIANLLIRRRTSVFIYVLMREYRALVNYIVLRNNVYNSDNVIVNFLM
jgi:hypothetical protein